MKWFYDLMTGESVAHAMLVISTAVVLGLALGSIKFGSVRFGVAGVLFGAIALGHLGFEVNHDVLEFCRELGLMLFVYLTGVQVGPGFFAAFKKQGIVLNGLAMLIVLLGVLTTVFIAKTWMSHDSFPLAVGLLSGATTNTPSLGAAQQAMIEQGLQAQSALTSVGYAVAYPFGVVGIILVMLVLRFTLRINLVEEQSIFNRLWSIGKSDLHQRHLKVSNLNVLGRPLAELTHSTTPPIIVSRILQNDCLTVAKPETILGLGDILLAVGSTEGLDHFQLLVGNAVEHSLTENPSVVDTRKALVTSSSVLGKTLQELDFTRRLNVNVTRLMRSGVELIAHPSTRLQFSDTLRLVGEPSMLQAAATELGDSRTALNSPRLVPMFLGLAVGILLGSIPISIPGIPVPIKLGLAGGPLIAAIILSRIGRIGPVIWHMPDNANRTLREFGIVLFLACVGLKAGGKFVETLISGDGLYYLLYGAIITVLPLLVVGFIGRVLLKQNYISLCGLLAGSMTDPPALAFAGTMTNSEGPAISYATVYPLVMILRVISTQVLVLLIW